MEDPNKFVYIIICDTVEELIPLENFNTNIDTEEYSQLVYHSLNNSKILNEIEEKVSEEFKSVIDCSSYDCIITDETKIPEIKEYVKSLVKEEYYNRIFDLISKVFRRY